MSPRRSTRRGLADDAEIDRLAGSGELLDDLDACRRSDGPSSSEVMSSAMEPVRRRMLGDEAFHRGDERRERRLHVGGAAAVQPAVALGRRERIGFPAFARPGRHDIGVAGEADERTRGAAPRPEVGDAVRNQRFAAEAERREPRGEQRLATGVVRRDRRARDQRAGELERGIDERRAVATTSMRRMLAKRGAPMASASGPAHRASTGRSVRTVQHLGVDLRAS